MSRQPWMKFYPADWQSDHLLRSCSIAARGLWIELLCIMQKAEPVGHLVVNGRAPAPAVLAVLCGVAERDVRKLLAELEAAGVFDMVDGVIVSRRMVRDAEKAERDKANGKSGGNPRLKDGVNPPPNPPDKPTVNGVDKAHIPEARSQKDSLGASAPPSAPPADRFEEFWQAYPKREGPNPKDPARKRFAQLAEAPGAVERIFAALPDLVRQHPAATRFVPQAITWLNQRRFEDDVDGSASPGGGEDWPIRLRAARRNRRWWPDEWGPLPGQPGCRVPADLIEAGDGEGWECKREAA